MLVGVGRVMKVKATPKLKGFYKQWGDHPGQPNPAFESAHLPWARPACWGGLVAEEANQGAMAGPQEAGTVHTRA